MNATVERHDLPLDRPFGIARGTKETTSVVAVELTHESEDQTPATGQTVMGIGAATPSAYYGESIDDAMAAGTGLADALEALPDPHAGQRFQRVARDVAPDAPAARAAASGALADCAARSLGVPLFRQLGIDPDATPPTSFTIGIASPSETLDRAREAVAAGHDVLKVKVGAAADEVSGTDDAAGRDRARLEAIREAAPDASLRVDANEAWTPDEARERLDWLASHEVDLLEQPVPADDLEGLAAVTRAAPMPVFADEACVDAGDVPRVAEACDGVVAKLSKCGGGRPAIRQIHAAHAHDLAVMLGCMVSSAAALAPACHLAPLVEYADLDGALLLAEDAYDGVPIEGSAIRLAAVARGTGARRQ